MSKLSFLRFICVYQVFAWFDNSLFVFASFLPKLPFLRFICVSSWFSLGLSSVRVLFASFLPKLQFLCFIRVFVVVRLV